VQTTKNVIAAYNLAQRMAYTNLGRQQWTGLTAAANTYDNTQPWINAAGTGVGAYAASQAASVARTSRLSDYGSLSHEGQEQFAAQGATADLNDSANATSLQTLGTIRANAGQREGDIAALERATHSVDPTQQTDLATLQRIKPGNADSTQNPAGD
jgi:hypothetical protein